MWRCKQPHAAVRVGESVRKTGKEKRLARGKAGQKRLARERERLARGKAGDRKTGKGERPRKNSLRSEGKAPKGATILERKNVFFFFVNIPVENSLRSE